MPMDWNIQHSLGMEDEGGIRDWWKIGLGKARMVRFPIIPVPLPFFGLPWWRRRFGQTTPSPHEYSTPLGRITQEAIYTDFLYWL